MSASLWSRLSSLGTKKEQLGWMNDSESDSCLICQTEFSIRIRRHHCRVCYRLVCGTCSQYTVQLKPGEGAVHRACNDCYARLGGAGSSSSLSVKQVRAANRVENAEQILVKLFVHAAEQLPAASESSFLGSSDGTRNAYCSILLDGKVVGTTSPVVSLSPIWKEIFQFRWTKTGPEMQFVVVEVWDKGRQIGGDELIGHCRVPLLRLKENMDIDIWHVLLTKEGRASQSRIRLTVQKGVIPGLSSNTGISVGTDPVLSPPPRPTLAHPMLAVTIPYSVKYSHTAASRRGLVELPLIQLFPPQSPIFHRLFIVTTTVKLASQQRSSVDFSAPYDDGTGDYHLYRDVIPPNEFLQEALGKVWLRLPGSAGGDVSSSLGAAGSGGGTVIVSSGGLRSTYWHGVLLLSTHRLIFIPYPSSTSGKRSGSTHSAQDSRVHWSSGQTIGPSLPLCVPISEIHSSSVKKNWKDRFNAIEIACKDSASFVFAVEKEKRNPLKDNATINTLRRIKEDLIWRKEEDGFAYISDILRLRNIETTASGDSGKEIAAPVTPNQTSNLSTNVGGSISSSASNTDRTTVTTRSVTGLVTKHHPHELDLSDEKRRNKSRCNVCSGGVKKCTYHCAKCNWDICETCINTERRYSQALPSSLPISADPTSSSAKLSLIPGPVNAQHVTDSAASSSSSNLRNFSASGISAADTDTEILFPNQHRNSLNGVEEIDVSVLPEPVIPYPQTDLQELETSFDICNDFRRQGLSKFYQWRISKLNTDFELCGTYPPALCVPRAITDTVLAAAAHQRSSRRLPILTWIHPTTGAALCRSSQPLTGMTNSLSPEDDQLLISIRQAAIDAQVQLHEQRTIARDVLALAANERKANLSDHRSTVSIPKGMEEIDPLRVFDAMLKSGEFGGSSGSYEQGGGNGDNDNDSSLLEDETLLSTLYSDSEESQDDGNGNGSDAAGSDIDPELHDDRDDGFEDADGRAIFDSDDEVDEHGRAIGDIGVDNEREKRNTSKDTIGRYNEISADMLKEFGLKKNNATTVKTESMLSTSTPGKSREKILVGSSVKAEKKKHNVRLRVLDARPIINAKGNALMGKGHEVIARLGGTECTTLKFANIENIHAMRTSYLALRKACAAANDGSDDWNHAVHESKWLHHISDVLKGSIYLATHLERGDPCLCHCSDGWDRTSQLTALAQLLLEPYYRTICGFRDLISKEFVAFGHKFRSRSTGSSFGKDNSEYSPIFIQFLDCVYQIWRQMPWEFEFNDKLLLLLAYAYNSRFTSDFLFDNLLERKREYRLRDLRWKEQTRACDGCWSVRTASKAQSLLDEASRNSFPGELQKQKLPLAKLAKSTNLGSISEENESESEDALPEIFVNIENDETTETTETVQDSEKSNNIASLQTPTTKETVARQSAQKLSDKDLHCESCLAKRNRISLSVWDHVLVELSTYKNTLYASATHSSADSVLCAERPFDADSLSVKPAVTNYSGFSMQSVQSGAVNFGDVIAGRARWNGPLGAQDLCAYPPATPRIDYSLDRSLEQISMGSTHSVAPVCGVEILPVLNSAEKDSMFTPPTQKTHGTPTLFPRTAGKVNTFSTPETEASVSSTPSVQLHTPAIGGQSIFDTIKRTSMKTAALATTSTDSGISKSLDAVFASQAAGVDSVDHNVPDKADTAPTSQSSAASKPRSVRPRCIRMITPRINIQSLVVWEALYMKSLPLASNNASSSVSVQRTLEAALELEQRKVALLYREIEQLRTKCGIDV